MSTGHRCEGSQIYSMPTDVYIYESKCSKVGESKSIVGCTLK